jgi:hypothetical protein
MRLEPTSRSRHDRTLPCPHGGMAHRLAGSSASRRRNPQWRWSWAASPEALGRHPHRTMSSGRCPRIPIRFIPASRQTTVKAFCLYIHLQHVCGQETLTWETPCHPSALGRFRKRSEPEAWRPPGWAIQHHQDQDPCTHHWPSSPARSRRRIDRRRVTMRSTGQVPRSRSPRHPFVSFPGDGTDRSRAPSQPCDLIILVVEKVARRPRYRLSQKTPHSH